MRGRIKKKKASTVLQNISLQLDTKLCHVLAIGVRQNTAWLRPYPKREYCSTEEKNKKGKKIN